MYNGEITGLEESFEFDAQHTFKVCSYIQICITPSTELIMHIRSSTFPPNLSQ